MTQKRTSTIIGSKELIGLPEHGLFDIPAKIDTGADSSAIWASEIRESDGELSFVLFAKGSRFYTGERISTDDFDAASIRNSFGHSEMRYKVRFVVKLGGRHIIARMTLADRSKNRYPILIGKKTIRKKFLVDVGEKNILPRQKTAQVLVLSMKLHGAIDEFCGDLNQQLQQEVHCTHNIYDNFVLSINDSKPHFYERTNGTSLESYDLVHFMTYYRHEELASAMAEYLTAKQVDFIDKEVATYHAKSKVTELTKLSLNGLPVPDTLSITRTPLVDLYPMIVETFGLPFILKSTTAVKGRNNYLIRSEKEFHKIIKDPTDELEYIAQRFIPNDGDVRVLVLDKRIYLALKRTAPDSSTHLTNTSVGGKAELLQIDELDSEVKTLALRAAAVMNRQVAGVDLLQDRETKKWYVLEVNNAPQIASGAFPSEKLQVFSAFLRYYTNKISLR
jgi:glutathione synthase/RimK-type ligase-like ATP-grasp enzyme